MVQFLRAFAAHERHTNKCAAATFWPTCTGCWPNLATIFHLLHEPVFADPFPEEDPLPGAYRPHLPSDDLTRYTVTENQDGQVVIVLQYLKTDT